MSFLLSNKDNMDSVLGAKDAAPYRRNPWLVALCFIILPAILVIGGAFTAKLFLQKTDNSKINIVSVSVVKKNRSSTNLEVGSKTVKKFAKKIHNAPKKLIVTVKSKDDLSAIFKRLGVGDEIAKSILALKKTKALKKLDEGRKISLLFGSSRAKLHELTYEVNDLDTLIVAAAKDGWRVETKRFKPVGRVKYLASTINGSIYTSAKKAGISPKVIMQFAKIFKHQVDPNRVRNGDKFALFYKEYIARGKKISDGNIVAAELIHKGKKHRVIGYTHPDGRTRFYDPKGRSVEQTIDRYPLKYRRIASRFSRSRLHPILKVRRAHLGVDLVARYGASVKATSDGRISFAGRKGGYGKTVVIKNGKYSSLYAHLSRFAKKTRSGRYVKRGDVIGYVGSTGLSTSAHLHYELRINGVHRDPLSVKLPTGGMIPSKHRDNFFALSKKMLARLDSYGEERILAMNSTPKL